MIELVYLMFPKNLTQSEVRMNMNFVNGFMVVTACILSGCSSYEENFSSEPGKGSGWKSTSETYFMDKGGEMSQKSPYQQKIVSAQPSQPAEKLIPIESEDGCSLKRRPEEFLRVWFAPFEDQDHNLYEESTVMTIVKQSQWVI